MTDKELVEKLREYAERAITDDEWVILSCFKNDFTKAADTIERLQSELTKEKIDNTNLIGELATVAAERDRYKAERDAAARDMKQNTKCYICKNFPKDNNISHCKHFYNCGLAYINWEWRGLEENT